MPLTVTDTTPLRLSIEGEPHETTLGLFLTNNEGLDVAAITSALAAGQTYSGGGGAEPAWCVEVAK